MQNIVDYLPKRCWTGGVGWCTLGQPVLYPFHVEADKLLIMLVGHGVKGPELFQGSPAVPCKLVMNGNDVEEGSIGAPMPRKSQHHNHDVQSCFKLSHWSLSLKFQTESRTHTWK